MLLGNRMDYRLLGLRTILLPVQSFQLETFSRVGIGLETFWLVGGGLKCGSSTCIYHVTSIWTNSTIRNWGIQCLWYM
jgi:hypothetical protein